MARVRYQALGPLMSGEGSRAFLGLEISEDNRAKPVVLVWAPEEVASSAEQREKLALETRRAAALLHPNILRVYSLAVMEDGVARVVEYADGESLRRVLEARKPLPPRIAAFVAAECALGIHFAHLMGSQDGSPWIHGDVRPETVMVAFNGHCKVTGYGALTVAPKEMYGSGVVGRRYSAPEQVMGGRDAATIETDVYLLGILLYECMTGQVPFSGENDADVAIISQPLPDIAFEEDIPLGLVQVIGKATAKKAFDRYPSALAFREAVDAAVTLPSTEEFAAYLKELFPEGEAVRAARRREIDTGIADFARRAWEAGSVDLDNVSSYVEIADTSAPEPGRMPSLRQLVTEQVRASGLRPMLLTPKKAAEAPAAPSAAPPPPPAPAPAAARPPPAGATPAAPIPTAPASAVPVQPPARTSHPAPPPLPRAAPPQALVAQPRMPSWALLLVGASIAFGAFGVWSMMHAQAPARAEAPAVPAIAPQAAEPVVEQAVAVVAAPEPEPEPEPPPEPPSLALNVVPAVEVMLGQRSLGWTPLELPMDSGRHILRLRNAGKGINVTRAVTVRKQGKTAARFVIGKGSVALSAPKGAEVFIGSRRIGVAPLSEFPVYEGRHLIRVDFKGAKWQQRFSVKPGETMYFTVETTE